jgi:ABC-type transporter Mla subunit MlaD
MSDTSDDDLAATLGSAFETIHDAVNASLAAATTTDQTSELLSEYNAARSAYTNATSRALNDADPSLDTLVNQLDAATQAINDTTQATNNAVSFFNAISKAVGIFTKIVALV